MMCPWSGAQATIQTPLEHPLGAVTLRPVGAALTLRWWRAVPEAQLFVRAGAYHAEGPFWDAHTDRLLYADVLAGTVVSVDADAASTRHQLPSPAVTVIRRRAS